MFNVTEQARRYVLARYYHWATSPQIKADFHSMPDCPVSWDEIFKLMMINMAKWIEEADSRLDDLDDFLKSHDPSLSVEDAELFSEKLEGVTELDDLLFWEREQHKYKRKFWSIEFHNNWSC